MKFFGEEEVMGVNESSKGLSGAVSRLFRGHRAIVIRDVFVLVFSRGTEGWVKEGSGPRVRGEHPVHLRMLRQPFRRESRSARGSSLGDMGVDVVTMYRRCRRGVVGNGVKVDHGISGDHVELLWGDVFRGSSFEVHCFLVPLEIMCRVVRRRGLECGW